MKQIETLCCCFSKLFLSIFTVEAAFVRQVDPYISVLRSPQSKVFPTELILLSSTTFQYSISRQTDRTRAATQKCAEDKSEGESSSDSVAMKKNWLHDQLS